MNSTTGSAFAISKRTTASLSPTWCRCTSGRRS